VEANSEQKLKMPGETTPGKFNVRRINSLIGNDRKEDEQT